MAFKMKGFSPFKYGMSMSSKSRETWQKRWEDKKEEMKHSGQWEMVEREGDYINQDNPYERAEGKLSRSERRELDELGKDNRYWQKDYQKKKRKQGVTTSGYLDAKYRRKGRKSYAPGID